jgi:hypothetical protein
MMIDEGLIEDAVYFLLAANSLALFTFLIDRCNRIAKSWPLVEFCVFIANFVSNSRSIFYLVLLSSKGIYSECGVGGCGHVRRKLAFLYE